VSHILLIDGRSLYRKLAFLRQFVANAASRLENAMLTLKLGFCGCSFAATCNPSRENPNRACSDADAQYRSQCFGIPITVVCRAPIMMMVSFQRRKTYPTDRVLRLKSSAHLVTPPGGPTFVRPVLSSMHNHQTIADTLWLHAIYLERKILKASGN